LTDPSTLLLTWFYVDEENTIYDNDCYESDIKYNTVHDQA